MRNRGAGLGCAGRGDRRRGRGRRIGRSRAKSLIGHRDGRTWLRCRMGFAAAPEMAWPIAAPNAGFARAARGWRWRRALRLACGTLRRACAPGRRFGGTARGVRGDRRGCGLRLRACWAEFRETAASLRWCCLGRQAIANRGEGLDSGLGLPVGVGCCLAPGMGCGCVSGASGADGALRSTDDWGCLPCWLPGLAGWRSALSGLRVGRRLAGIARLGSSGRGRLGLKSISVGGWVGRRLALGALGIAAGRGLGLWGLRAGGRWGAARGVAWRRARLRRISTWRFAGGGRARTAGLLFFGPLWRTLVAGLIGLGGLAVRWLGVRTLRWGGFFAGRRWPSGRARI